MKQYILKKDFPRLGKEIGDYYNNEFAESIEELIKKGVIEEEPSIEQPEPSRCLKCNKFVGVGRIENICQCPNRQADGDIKSEPADWEKELKKLLNDNRTGLKDSSDTNKTRYAILALFDQAKKEGAEEEREKLDIKIGMLRQWLNEKPKDLIVTNEHLKTFLIK